MEFANNDREGKKNERCNESKKCEVGRRNS